MTSSYSFNVPLFGHGNSRMDYACPFKLPFSPFNCGSWRITINSTTISHYSEVRNYTYGVVWTGCEAAARFNPIRFELASELWDGHPGFDLAFGSFTASGEKSYIGKSLYPAHGGNTLILIITGTWQLVVDRPRLAGAFRCTSKRMCIALISLRMPLI